jgi:hypothetical protein
VPDVQVPVQFRETLIVLPISSLTGLRQTQQLGADMQSGPLRGRRADFHPDFVFFHLNSIIPPPAMKPSDSPTVRTPPCTASSTARVRFRSDAHENDLTLARLLRVGDLPNRTPRFSAITAPRRLIQRRRKRIRAQHTD